MEQDDPGTLSSIVWHLSNRKLTKKQPAPGWRNFLCTLAKIGHNGYNFIRISDELLEDPVWVTLNFQSRAL